MNLVALSESRRPGFGSPAPVVYTLKPEQISTVDAEHHQEGGRATGRA
jgi:hypothetical protein